MGIRALVLGVLALCSLATAGAAASPRTALPPKPTVTIVAHFVQADFATYYVAHVVPEPGPEPVAHWSLKPPANDPNCDKFKSDEVFLDQAEWFHGDQDGCDHTKMGPQGHQGVITLYYDDANWSCTTTYSGTNDGTSAPATCETAAKVDAEDAVDAALADEQAAAANVKAAGAAAKVRSSLAELAKAKAALGRLTLRGAADAKRHLNLATKSDKFALHDIETKDFGEAAVGLHDAMGDKQNALEAIARLP